VLKSCDVTPGLAHGLLALRHSTTVRYISARKLETKIVWNINRNLYPSYSAVTTVTRLPASPGAEGGPVCNQMSPHFDSWSW